MREVYLAKGPRDDAQPPAGLLGHGASPRNPTRHAIQVNDAIVERCQAFGGDMRALEIGMQTFYFDCEHAACRDECLGHALANYREAHRMGIRFVGELLQHEPEGLIDGHDLNVTVSDDKHLALFTIHASSIASAAINGSRQALVRSRSHVAAAADLC